MLVSEGANLSMAMEEFLRSLLASKWVEELAEGLNLGSLDPLDPSSLAKSRPKGMDSARMVRELRDQRLNL